MSIKMNDKLINKVVDDVVSTVNFLCKNELSYLELTSKIDALNDKMYDLKNLVVYSDDEHFTNTICAMQIITDNFNEEISKDFGRTFSNDFKERQLNFLRNISSSFDINIIEVDNVSSVSNSKEIINREYENKVYQTKEKYKKETTKETVNDIIKATNEKLDSYFESEKDLKEYLSYMAKFHNYSIGNCSKIEEQFSGAVAVGSFKFWKDNGFSVNKGEKGIQILVPTPVKNFYDEEGNIKRLSYATKEQKEKLKKGILKDAPTSMSYKKGYVFDVSQTNATTDDLPRLFPNKWLDGEVKDYDKMYKALENVAHTIGVNIIAPKSELGAAKGISYTLSKEIALNPRNSQLQNVKTLIHELAHAKLHTATTHNQYTKAEKEFEAEMVAFCVSSYFGLDTSEYSLRYLHHYTKNTDIKEKKKLLKEIKDTSQEFIEIIEDTISNNLEIKNTLDKNNNLSDDKISVADKIDNTIYTKFVWSESEEIEDGSIYRFEIANEILETLTKIYQAKGVTGYDKTKFELYFDKECTDKFYTGRFDIGDGYATDLKDHIHKNVSNMPNISTNKKQAIFSTLGINKNKSTLAKNKNIGMEL